MNNIDSINSAGVTVKGQHVSWRELTLAATQDDAALAAAYGALLDRAISQYGAMGLGGADYHAWWDAILARLQAVEDAAHELGADKHFAVIHAGEGGDLEAVVAAQERALAEASR